MLQEKHPPQQAAKGEAIKALFRQAAKLHQAGYQVKITRHAGNVAVLQEKYAT